MGSSTRLKGGSVRAGSGSSVAIAIVVAGGGSGAGAGCSRVARAVSTVFRRLKGLALALCALPAHFCRVKSSLGRSKHCPARGREHVVLGGEGLAAGGQLMELVVVDPCVPSPISQEPVRSGQHHTAGVRMLACQRVLAVACVTQGLAKFNNLMVPRHVFLHGQAAGRGVTAVGYTLDLNEIRSPKVQQLCVCQDIIHVHALHQSQPVHCALPLVPEQP
mmetsp:Transcript_13791/g.37270  ORF Transcript_13791/g.37270 Transcript_13791/m.37270 type:complete len:219 (-) Transcript_13791:1973-2629(-)